MKSESYPYQPHSETSRDAAARVSNSEAARKAILQLMTRVSAATDEMIQMSLEMNPSTQRPRRIELVEAGLIRDSGRTSPTISGRKATLWELVPESERVERVKQPEGELQGVLF